MNRNPRDGRAMLGALCGLASWGALLAPCSPAFCQVIVLRPPQREGMSLWGFGEGVAGIVDANGDGSGDVAVGASQDQVIGEEGIGRVYIYSGRTGELLRTLHPTQCGGQSLLGVNVVGIDDADGDNRGDVLASAHVETCPGGPWAAGAAYLFSGGSGDTLHHFRSVPEFSVANIGIFLSTVPNVEGPGTSAVLVADSVGRASIFSPRSGKLIVGIQSVPMPEYEGLVAIGGVGDLNGNGAGDVVMTAALRPFRPGSTIWVTEIYDGLSGDFIHRIEPWAYAIAPFIDIDNDGVDDMIFGHDQDTVPGLPQYTGTVRIVSGATGAVIRTITSPHAASSSRFGIHVRAMEDCNADGVADILVSARGESRPDRPRGAGVVYVFSGADGTMIHELFSPRPIEWGHFGGSIDTVPDANGDGRQEILVAAAGELYGHIEGRQAYLFLSCRADWNWDSRANSQDFFDFLSAFFAADPRADFNGDAGVDSTDFFDFLKAFFEGCSY